MRWKYFGAISVLCNDFLFLQKLQISVANYFIAVYVQTIVVCFAIAILVALKYIAKFNNKLHCVLLEIIIKFDDVFCMQKFWCNQFCTCEFKQHDINYCRQSCIRSGWHVKIRIRGKYRHEKTLKGIDKLQQLWIKWFL